MRGRSAGSVSARFTGWARSQGTWPKANQSEGSNQPSLQYGGLELPRIPGKGGSLGKDTIILGRTLEGGDATDRAKDLKQGESGHDPAR